MNKFHAIEMRAVLGCYAASSGNGLPTFRDKASVPSSRSKKSNKWTSWPLEMGLIRCPESSVKGYHSTLHNTLEERRTLWRNPGIHLSVMFHINLFRPSGNFMYHQV
jgi:hypothetical protein